MAEAPRIRRSWTIWACKALAGLAVFPSPHNWSISRSELTGRPRLSARRARRARCFAPRTGRVSPPWTTSSSPNSFTSTSPRYDRWPRRARHERPTRLRATSVAPQVASARCLPDPTEKERKHHDRGEPPHQALWQDRRGGRGLLYRESRPGDRLPRTERG